MSQFIEVRRADEGGRRLAIRTSNISRVEECEHFTRIVTYADGSYDCRDSYEEVVALIGEEDEYTDPDDDEGDAWKRSLN